jgi:hypothetical protein
MRAVTVLSSTWSIDPPDALRTLIVSATLSARVAWFIDIATS